MPAKVSLLCPTALALMCIVLTPRLFAQSENILPNGDFELGAVEEGRPPDKWDFAIESGGKVTGGLTTSFARSGARAVVLRHPLRVTDKWQALTHNTPIQAGKTYEFSVWAHYDPADPLMGGSNVKASIEWKAADGNEIERVMSDPWTGPKIARAGGWTEIKVRSTAPKGATRASFVVTCFRGSKRDSAGSIILDDASVKLVEEPTK